MKLFPLLCFVLFSTIASAQTPADIARVYNRTATALPGGGIHFNALPGAGIAWLKGAAFKTGTLSFDLRGKDVLQQSFVGIAFHGINDTTYDAIYLRPFNFRAMDPIRKRHAVQYISMPRYDWEPLRNQYPGKYENSLDPAPDPVDWVHVKLVVTAKTVTVFVNDKQCLRVDLLSHTATGQLGLWVGNGSDGDWRNLKIQRD